MRPKKSPLAMVSTGEYKIQRMRRILWISLLILIIAAVIWVYLKLNQANTFPITTVRVEGSYPHLSRKEFETQIAPYATGGFFQINVAQIKEQALTFPWIYQVDVRKVFPSTLIVSITEQTPIAQWNNQALLNAEGDLFQPPIVTFPPNLPQLFGPDNQYSMMLASFDRMNQILQPLNLHIMRMNLSMRRSWTIQLDNNLEIILGRNFIWQRLKRFVTIYPKIFTNSKRKPKSVDLRYPNGIAVAWQN